MNFEPIRRKLFSAVPVFFAVAGILVSCTTSGNVSESDGNSGAGSEPDVRIMFDSSRILRDEGNTEFSGIGMADLMKEMRTGWNLGNSLDATGSGLGSETSWSQPKTTKAMIDGIAAAGFRTIRIPVSWSNHINKKTYTIDERWMARVKEIVDWAISDGLYVIINSHHDCYHSPSKMPQGSGYYPNAVNYDESARFLLNVWTQIGTAFNGSYDEHLIFETMNEPRLRGTNCEWWNDVNSGSYRESAGSLNRLNQVALDAIRATGGNNSRRFVICPGLRAAADSVLAKEFRMPQDSEAGRLIVSVHAYSPYNFAMASPGETEFTQAHKNELARMFSQLNQKFVQDGYGVIIGEYGAVNKNNLEDRVEWFKFYLTSSYKQYGIVSCLWDNGAWKPQGNDYNEKFGYYDRIGQKWFFPEILDAIMDSTDLTETE